MPTYLEAFAAPIRDSEVAEAPTDSRSKAWS